MHLDLLDCGRDGEGANHTALQRARIFEKQRNGDRYEFWNSVAAEIEKLQPAVFAQPKS
jgi:hypothetical protein